MIDDLTKEIKDETFDFVYGPLLSKLTYLTLKSSVMEDIRGGDVQVIGSQVMSKSMSTSSR